MDCKLGRFIRLEELEGSKIKVRRVRRLEGLSVIFFNVTTQSSAEVRDGRQRSGRTSACLVVAR